MNITALSHYADTALSAVGLKNKAFLIAAPAIAVGALGIGTRVTAGTLALACKGLSKAADYAGKKVFGESLSNAKDSLYGFATRSIKAELTTTVALTAAAAGAYGVTKLLTQPQKIELSCIEKFKNYLYS